MHLAVAIGAAIVLVVYLLTLGPSSSPQDPAANASPTNHAPASYLPTVHSSLPASFTFPGRATTLPMPRKGQATVEVAGLGIVGTTPKQRCVPIASLTKIMTAYIILKDHPLTGDAGGPIFTMTASDHASWIAASEADDSNIEVVAGERLDERQLLQALVIPSADNIADYLAVWDAGSIQAFVAKMNATAKTLGLGCTHYADASGVNPGSRSTAGDIAKLVSLAMQNPELRSITDEQQIVLPVTGEIWNEYNPAIGVDGIIGVKSGFTDAAQSCLATAAWRRVGSHRVLVVSVVTGQLTGLSGAAQEDENLLEAVTGELTAKAVVAASADVGTASAAWVKSKVGLRLDSDAMTVVGWPGFIVSPVVVEAGLQAGHKGWKAGTPVASVEIESPLGVLASEPAELAGPIAPVPSGWVPPPNALSH